MLPAVAFMVVALVCTVALWRMLTPTLADKQQPEPVRIPTDEELLHQKRD